MEEYLSETFDHLSTVFNTDRIDIQIIDNHGYYIFKKWQGISDEFRNAVKDLHIWEPTEKHFGSLFIRDIQKDDRFKEIKSILKKEKIKSCSFSPLVINNNLFGRFSIYFSDIHEFNDWEIQLINTTSIGISILLDKGKYRNELTKTDIVLLRKRNNELFKAVETIHSRESILQEAFEIANLGIWEYFIELNEFRCSEEFLYLFDIEPGKKCITLSELLDKVCLDDINIINSAFGEAINQKKNMEFIIRHIKNDKNIKYLQVKVKPKLGKGKVEKLAGIVLDITNFKRTEIEIYNSFRQEKEINRRSSQSNLDTIHELQKFLIDISAAMNVIELDLSSNTDYGKKRYFNNTQSSIANIYNIINSLNKFSANLIKKVNNNSEAIDLVNPDEGVFESSRINISNANDTKLVSPNQVLIEVGNKSKLIKINDIEFITAMGNYTNLFVLNEGNITMRKILKEWLKILPEVNFLRIHRSCAINLEHVQEIEKWYNSSFRIKMKNSKTTFVTSYRFSKLIRKKLKP